jgi:hypothetical protein
MAAAAYHRKLAAMAESGSQLIESVSKYRKAVGGQYPAWRNGWLSAMPWPVISIQPAQWRKQRRRKSLVMKWLVNKLINGLKGVTENIRLKMAGVSA